MTVIHRLTVDGKDYFLPHPVDALKGKILNAIQGGGGYVTIPPLRGGPGLDILFSPGMPVVWAQIEVPEVAAQENITDSAFDEDLG